MTNLFEIFYRFLLLGVISFGGPMAHLGYFRKTFVEKLKIPFTFLPVANGKSAFLSFSKI